MEEDGRPEESMINRYLRLRKVAGSISIALGCLALVWSTVVLLGGFAHHLRPKEFWLLTALTFALSLRQMLIEIFVIKNCDIGMFWDEYCIINALRRQEWMKAHKTIIMLRMARVLKWVFAFCFLPCHLLWPFVSLGISVIHLVRRDHGDAGGDIIANRSAKLNAALDIFYALLLLQSLCTLYCSVINRMDIDMPFLTNKCCGLEEEEWGLQVVQMYHSETRRKIKKDGELPKNWNLITYAVRLLQSASEDGHLWGARVLDKLFDKDDASVRQELLSSRSSIQNLISMIGQRGTADIIEKRERATRILAHLATDVNITHFPGTVQCICSLLERSSCKQYFEPQVTCPWEHTQQRLPDKKDQHMSLKTSQYQDGAHTVVPIEGETEHDHEKVVSSSPAGLAKRKRTSLVCEMIMGIREGFQEGVEQAVRKATEDRSDFAYESIGAKELISQGMLILERLTQDEENCTEISRHQRLLSKITSPLSNHDFLSNVQDKKMVEMLSKSLTVVSRLLSSPGDGAKTLRQELSSKAEAVNTLMAILETDSEGAQELHEQALEILTELAFDDSFKKLDFNKLLKALVQIFLEDEAQNTGEDANNTIVDVANRTTVEVEQADRDQKAARRRRKAGEALARLLTVHAATDVNVADKLTKQEAIDILTKVLDQILSSNMGKTADAVKRVVTEKKNLVIGVLDQILSSKMGIFADTAIRAVRETKKLVIEEHDQILYSKMGTNADAAKRALTKIQNLSAQVLGTLLPSKMETTVFVGSLLRLLILGIEKQSEEIKFMASILSVTMAMCNKNVISKEDFARATPEDAALVKKLKEILKINNNRTGGCLKVVKLTCHVVIAMIQVQPSCIQHFHEHNFKEALTEALETMSEVDDCMLFAGNDHEVIKPARSLASLVKEAQELLNTAQEHGY